jgi:hypothetical protein
MTVGEAAAWRGRITSAEETDMFARNPESTAWYQCEPDTGGER